MKRPKDLFDDPTPREKPKPQKKTLGDFDGNWEKYKGYLRDEGHLAESLRGW